MARLHRHRQIPPLLQTEDMRQARGKKVDQVADGYEILILQPQGEGCQGEVPYAPLQDHLEAHSRLHHFHKSLRGELLVS